MKEQELVDQIVHYLRNSNSNLIYAYSVKDLYRFFKHNQKNEYCPGWHNLMTKALRDAKSPILIVFDNTIDPASGFTFNLNTFVGLDELKNDANWNDWISTIDTNVLIHIEKLIKNNVGYKYTKPDDLVAETDPDMLISEETAGILNEIAYYSEPIYQRCQSIKSNKFNSNMSKRLKFIPDYL